MVSTLLDLTKYFAMNIFSLASPVKRFYKDTNILESGGKFEITLDQRKLKTPKGSIFTVESEALALAVATEWNSQKDKILQSKLHLVRFFAKKKYLLNEPILPDNTL